MWLDQTYLPARVGRSLTVHDRLNINRILFTAVFFSHCSLLLVGACFAFEDPVMTVSDSQTVSFENCGFSTVSSGTCVIQVRHSSARPASKVAC